MLGISPATVQRYAREGRIPFSLTPGGHRRFDIDEVKRALGVREEVDETAEPRLEERGGRPTATAVIVTALGLEFEAVVESLEDTEARRLAGGTRYEVGSLSGDSIDWTIAVAEIGEGNIGAAVEATRAIEEFRPHIVLVVGVAGSLKEDVSHGSVVVATKVYRYHSGKAAEDFYSRPVTFPTWHSIEQLVRQVRRSQWAVTTPPPTVELKPIAAGEVVVASKDSETFLLLKERCNDAVAVDMESAGVYEAVHRSERIPGLAVRGISDMISDKSPAVDAQWQATAARHAAAFAVALLRAADPGDLRLAPPPAPFPTEREELLGTVPPPAANAIQRAEEEQPREALRLLRAMNDSSQDPAALARELTEKDGERPAEDASAHLWVAVGEFAAAHGQHGPACLAFAAAAGRDKLNAGRWFARAALAAAAGGNQRSVAELLKKAKKHATPESVPFVDVMEAAIAEDADRVIAAASAQGPGDALVDAMHINALDVVGRVDEAITQATTSLTSHPSRSFSGGIALATARLLIRRAQESSERGGGIGDMERARELALQVRDARRQWRGPSWEAARVAAIAAGAAHDLRSVLQIALPFPDGDATEDEATDSELRIRAANAALALGKFDQARELASAIEEEAERLILEAECARAAGSPTPRVRSALEKAVKVATSSHQRLRALLSLAELGVWPLEGLDTLADEDAEGAELVLAEADASRGKVDAAIRRLRQLGSERGLALLVETYVEAERVDDAVEALRLGAERFGQARFRLRAARLLASLGRLDEARDEAAAGMLMTPAGNYSHADFRMLSLELSARVGDWDGVVAHARAALGEGIETDDVRWALVGALFNKRTIEVARSEMDRFGLQPRSEEEARLAIQLRRTDAPTPSGIAVVVGIAERFRHSEDVNAAALSAVMEMSREIELPEDVVDGVKSLTDRYFEQWPESRLVTRIDASDPTRILDYLREHLAPAAREFAPLAADVLLGRMPYGLLTAAHGRSLAEAIVKGQLGCLPVGTPDLSGIEAEDAAALAALDGGVVVDTHALYVMDVVADGAGPLAALFARLLATRPTLDDALEARDALGLRSTATMGWDPPADRPVIIEIDEVEADRWARRAEQLVARARDCVIKDVSESRDEPPSPGTERLLSSLWLARKEGVPLWSDDPAIRSVARNEGVPTFGTVSLVRALAERGALTGEQHDQALQSMMRARLVDLPTNPEHILGVAEEENWRGEAAALPLSRPFTWTDPLAAFRIYRECVVHAVEEAPEAVETWTGSAALGLGRAVAPPIRGRAIATVLVSGFLGSGGDPNLLPQFLAGIRAAAEVVGADDPLRKVAQMLLKALREEFGEDRLAQLFAHIVSALDDADRTDALKELLRPGVA